MLSWKTDVAVLLIFFARPNTLEKVFEQIKKARPRTLLLWQDGPRQGNDKDLEGIKKCREIVENIDWDCTVYRQYHEENIGCDPSTFMAQKWAFSIVDKCIILEDDQVVADSYFAYCKELLDLYENDNRINHICGYNVVSDVIHCPSDYLFAYTGSGVWASWRRVADGWDDTYVFLHDEYAMKNLEKKYGKRRFRQWYNKACERENIGKAYWESILGFDCLLNNRYAIIPTKNLASNYGLTENSTHSDTEIHLLEKSQQAVFNSPVSELEFPLKHPKYVVPDFEYMDKMDRLMGNGHPWLNLYRRIVYVLKCVRYGETRRITDAIKRRLKR